jgi:hypothetical protein
MPLFQAAARLCLYQAIKALDPVGNYFLLLITANCQKDTQRLQPLLLAPTRPGASPPYYDPSLASFRQMRPDFRPGAVLVEALMRRSAKRLTLVGAASKLFFVASQLDLHGIENS